MGLFTLLQRRREEKKRDEAFEDLIKRVEKLDRQMASLQLDWENAYDRLHQLMGRVSKRAEIAAKAERMHEEAEGNGDLHNSNVEIPPQIPGYLTPRQKQIQLSILAKRRNVGGH
jgi:hypothetical protein